MNQITQSAIDAAKQAARAFAAAHDGAVIDKSVYIAGPMSGLPDLNYPAFDAAAFTLRAAGFRAENPAENEPSCNAPTWEDYMRLALPQMLKCQSVLLLPGWQSSKGARVEARTALDMNMIVFDAEAGTHLQSTDEQGKQAGAGQGEANELQELTAAHSALRGAWNDLIAAMFHCDPLLFSDPTVPAVEAVVDSVWRLHAKAQQSQSEVSA